MILLTRVVDHTENGTTCLVALTEDSPFCGPDGVVPAWVGIEYMAQCVAAHAGLRARTRGEPIKIGFLLGSRRIEVRTAAFAAGQVLEVHVRHLWGEREFGSFACSVVDGVDGTLLMEGTLSVFLAHDIGRTRPAARRVTSCVLGYRRESWHRPGDCTRAVRRRPSSACDHSQVCGSKGGAQCTDMLTS